jgi:hypothetical protein
VAEKMPICDPRIAWAASNPAPSTLEALMPDTGSAQVGHNQRPFGEVPS